MKSEAKKEKKRKKKGVIQKPSKKANPRICAGRFASLKVLFHDNFRRLNDFIHIWHHKISNAKTQSVSFVVIDKFQNFSTFLRLTRNGCFMYQFTSFVRSFYVF